MQHLGRQTRTRRARLVGGRRHMYSEGLEPWHKTTARHHHTDSASHSTRGGSSCSYTLSVHGCVTLQNIGLRAQRCMCTVHAPSVHACIHQDRVGCAQSAATAWAAAGVDCMVVSRVTPQYAEAHSVRARMTRHITGGGALVGGGVCTCVCTSRAWASARSVVLQQSHGLQYTGTCRHYNGGYTSSAT